MIENVYESLNNNKYQLQTNQISILADKKEASQSNQKSQRQTPLEKSVTFDAEKLLTKDVPNQGILEKKLETFRPLSKVIFKDS